MENVKTMENISIIIRCKDCKTQIKVEPGSHMEAHAKTLILRNKLGKPYRLDYTNCTSEMCCQMKVHKQHRPPSVGSAMDRILL